MLLLSAFIVYLHYLYWKTLNLNLSTGTALNNGWYLQPSQIMVIWWFCSFCGILVCSASSYTWHLLLESSFCFHQSDGQLVVCIMCFAVVLLHWIGCNYYYYIVGYKYNIVQCYHSLLHTYFLSCISRFLFVNLSKFGAGRWDVDQICILPSRNIKKAKASGALPQTLLGELKALPRPLSWI